VVTLRAARAGITERANVSPSMAPEPESHALRSARSAALPELRRADASGVCAAFRAELRLTLEELAGAALGARALFAVLPMPDPNPTRVDIVAAVLAPVMAQLGNGGVEFESLGEEEDEEDEDQ